MARVRCPHPRARSIPGQPTTALRADSHRDGLTPDPKMPRQPRWSANRPVARRPATPLPLWCYWSDTGEAAMRPAGPAAGGRLKPEAVAWRDHCHRLAATGLAATGAAVLLVNAECFLVVEPCPCDNTAYAPQPDNTPQRTGAFRTVVLDRGAFPEPNQKTLPNNPDRARPIAA
jgi:hypothetical protein